MSGDPAYWFMLLPQVLSFIIYFAASTCMAISYVKLKGLAKQSGNSPLGVVATGFGFYFLGFIVSLLMSVVGLVFASRLGMMAYYGIQYAQYLFTIIGTVYFVIGAKQFLAAKS